MGFGGLGFGVWRVWGLGWAFLGAKRSGPAFRLRVCLSWVWVFEPGLFGGPKGPDPVSGLGSACLGSGCSGLGFFFGGPNGPDPVSGLGSACLGSRRSGLRFFFWGGRRSRPNFWFRVCLLWRPGLLGRPKGPDPVSGLGRT